MQAEVKHHLSLLSVPTTRLALVLELKEGWTSQKLSQKSKEMTMRDVREPLLKPIPITDLRPTQITVGMREVKAKRKRWREEGTTKGAEFLGKHMIPVILGPKQRHYVIDHHHLALALHGEGVKDILVTIVANLSKLEKDS